MADDINLDDVVVQRPTNGRVVQTRLDFVEYVFQRDVRFTLGGATKEVSVNITAAEVIAASSAPSQMQARLVEMRQILNALTKTKVKAALEV
jgi:hypothetical protein